MTPLDLEYTVVFMVNVGGTVYPHATVPVSPGDLLVPPDDEDILALHGGQSFRGWFASDEATEPFDFSKPITQNMVDENNTLTLTARCVFGSYLVRYLDADGKVIKGGYIEDVKSGDPLPSPPEGWLTSLAIPANQIFGGWYRDSGLTLEAPPFVGRDITLYPKIVTLHTVFFDSDGGTSVPTQIVEDGNKAVSPDVPIKSGWSFEGWYTDSNLQTLYDFTIPVTGSLVLHAKWTSDTKVPFTYAIYCEKPNVVVEPETDIANYEIIGSITSEAQAGTTISRSDAEAALTTSIMNDLRDSYSALKYSELASVSETVINSNGTSVVNIYFTRIVYEVTLNVNAYSNGATPRGPNNVPYILFANSGARYDNIATNPDYPAYVFKTKYEADLVGIWPTTDDIYTGSQLNYYGWAIGGSSSNPEPHYNLTKTPEYLLDKADSAHQVTANLVTTGSLVRTYRLMYVEMTEAEKLAYTGAGDLADIPEYNASYTVDGASYRTYIKITNGQTVTYYKLQEDLILSAYDAPAAGTIGFTDGITDGGTGGSLYTRALTYVYEPTQQYNTRHVHSIYNRKELTVTLNVQGGDSINPSSYSVTYGEPIPDLPKDENEMTHPMKYTFGGWYWDISFLIPYTENSIMPGHDVPLYALWIKEPVEVSFYPEADLTSLLIGSPVVISKGGYLLGGQAPVLGDDFAGWLYYDEAKEAFLPIDDITKIPINSDTQFYARYSYTVTYAPGTQGTWDVEDETHPGLLYGDPTPPFTGDTATTLQPGWVFNGWLPSVTSKVTNNATYTAQWRPTVLEVTFISGTGGVLRDADDELLVEPVNFPDISYNTPWATAVTVPTPDADDGFRFVGWTPTFPGTVTESKTYTATFEPIDDLVVIYDPGTHGTWSAADETRGGILYGTTTPAFGGNTATDHDLGWAFAGWLPSVASTVTDDVTYIAQWVRLIELPDPFELSLSTTDLLRVTYGDTAPSDDVVAATLLAELEAYIEAQDINQDINLTDLDLRLSADSSGFDEYVGSYEYDLKIEYNKNDFLIVSPEYVQAWLTIIPRPITITTSGASKVFDGTALTIGLWSYSGERLGDAPDITVSGSQTAVGSSQNTVADGWQIFRGPIDVTGNYVIIWDLGTLTVNPVPVVPVVPPVAPPAAPVVPAAPVAAAPADDAPAVAPIPDAPTPTTPAPTTPAAPDDDGETISEPEPPLVSGDTGSAWALLNLILAVVGTLLAFVVLVAFFIGRKEEKEKDERIRNEEYTQEQQRRKRIGLRIVSCAAAVIAIIIFLLTEDMTQPMQLVDLWTIVHVIIFIAQIVLTIFATYKKSDDDTKPLATSQVPTA
jgi:uncharacterized repeat protein (TIGR02543 family)